MNQKKQDTASSSNSSLLPDLESLMRTYGNDVLRTAWLYVKDFQSAEDIFQEVFLKIHNNPSAFQGRSQIKTWILQITINTCKDYLKSAWHRRVVPMMDFKEETLISGNDYDEIEKNDQKQLIRQSIESLPLKYRELLILVYYQELSLSDAAKVLKLPAGTAKSRLKRSRDKLKQLLEGRL